MITEPITQKPVNGSPVPVAGAGDVLQARSATPEKTEKSSSEETFVWIVNDGLLRDEGVLFGLSGADPSEKLDAIRSYYATMQASHQAAMAMYESRLMNAKESFAKTEERIAFLEARQKQLTVMGAGVTGAHFIRYVLGLSLMIIAVYGSYRIMDYYIMPVYGRAAALGIFFFALFSQMVPISSWVQVKAADDKQSKPARLAELLLETGPSVSVTLLTGYLVYQASGKVWLCIFLCFFLLFLLFFSGKLILGLSQHLSVDIRRINGYLAERRKVKRAKRSARKETRLLEIQAREFSNLVSEYEGKINAASAGIDELMQQALHKEKLFMSEYRLAAHFSGTLKPTSDEQQ